jgi:membrane protein YdbS with pleckstrin-like domain
MKLQIAKALIWAWALVFILCLYAVFFVSWLWTSAAVLYVLASVVALNFMAPQDRRNAESSKRDHRA